MKHLFFSCIAILFNACRCLIDGSPTYARNWMIFLKHPKGFCGGILYTQSLVVTAAHCSIFPINEWKAYLNLHSVKSLPTSHSEQKILMRINHQNYQSANLFYDVSVWWINGRSNLYTGVALDNGIGLDKNLEVAMLGWGNTLRVTREQRAAKEFATSYPSVLHNITLPLVPDKLCSLRYPVKFKPDFMFCTGKGDSGPGASIGDSGGPVFRTNRFGNIILLGIISFCEACGYKDYYDVNVKISNPSITKFINFYVPYFNPKNVVNGFVGIVVPVIKGVSPNQFDINAPPKYRLNDSNYQSKLLCKSKKE